MQSIQQRYIKDNRKEFSIWKNQLLIYCQKINHFFVGNLLSFFRCHGIFSFFCFKPLFRFFGLLEKWQKVLNFWTPICRRYPSLVFKFFHFLVFWPTFRPLCSTLGPFEVLLNCTIESWLLFPWSFWVKLYQVNTLATHEDIYLSILLNCTIGDDLDQFLIGP